MTSRRKFWSHRLCLVLLFWGLIGCEDPTRAPVKPTYLDSEQELIRQNLPWPAGSPGGASLEARMAHHQVSALAIGLVEGGEVRFVVTAGQQAGAKVSPATTFDATPMLDWLLAVGWRRFQQEQPGAGAPPSTSSTAELASSLAQATGQDLSTWIAAEIFRRAKMAHGTVTGATGNLRWQASATDLAALIVDLQKAAAGRPARSLKQKAALELLQPGQPGLSAVFDVKGQGQAVFFGRQVSNATGSVWLRGYLSSGQGVVILTDAPHGLALSTEIATAIAELYHWPREAP